MCVEGFAFVGEAGGEFRNHAAGADGVLVAYEVADEVAVALLAAHDEGVPHLLLDFFGNVFEARQHVEAFDVEGLGDGPDQFGGDDGLDGELLAGKTSVLLPLRQQVIDEERAGHVAVEQLHLAVVVADGDTHAVGVGVGGEDEVGTDFIGLADSQFHR